MCHPTGPTHHSRHTNRAGCSRALMPTSAHAPLPFPDRQFSAGSGAIGADAPRRTIVDGLVPRLPPAAHRALMATNRPSTHQRGNFATDTAPEVPRSRPAGRRRPCLPRLARDSPTSKVRSSDQGLRHTATANPRRHSITATRAARHLTVATTGPAGISVTRVNRSQTIASRTRTRLTRQHPLMSRAARTTGALDGPALAPPARRRALWRVAADTPLVPSRAWAGSRPGTRSREDLDSRARTWLVSYISR